MSISTELKKETDAFRSVLARDYSDEIKGEICIEFLKRFRALEEEANKKQLGADITGLCHQAVKIAFNRLTEYLPEEEDAAGRFLGEVVYVKGLIEIFDNGSPVYKPKGQSACKDLLKNMPKQQREYLRNQVWQLQAQMGDQNFPDTNSRRFCVLLAPIGGTPEVLWNDYLVDKDWNRLLGHISSIATMRGLNGEEALHRIVQCVIHSLNTGMQQFGSGNLFELLQYDLGTGWNQPLLSMEMFLTEYERCLLEKHDQIIDNTIPPVSGNSLTKPEILTYRTIPPSRMDRESYADISGYPLFAENSPTALVPMETKSAYAALQKSNRLGKNEKLVAVSNVEYEQLFNSASASRKAYLDTLMSKMSKKDALFFNDQLMTKVNRSKTIRDFNAEHWSKNGHTLLSGKKFIKVEVWEFKKQNEIATDMRITKSAVSQQIKTLRKKYPEIMDYYDLERELIKAQQNPILMSSRIQTNKDGKEGEIDYSDEDLRDNEP